MTTEPNPNNVAPVPAGAPQAPQAAVTGVDTTPPAPPKPAHLQNVEYSGEDAFAGIAAGGYNVLSIANTMFSIVSGGEVTRVPYLDQNGTVHEGVACTTLDLIVLGSNDKCSKAFYLKPFQGNRDKPICLSMNGITPDPSSTHKQANSCAECPHDIWGSGRVSDDGTKSGKRCGDRYRLAVAFPDQIEKPILLSVPPASFKNLRAYNNVLKKEQTDSWYAITRITVVPGQKGGQVLNFELAGYVNEAQKAAVDQFRGANQKHIDTMTGKNIPATLDAASVISPAEVHANAIEAQAAFAGQGHAPPAQAGAAAPLSHQAAVAAGHAPPAQAPQAVAPEPAPANAAPQSPQGVAGQGPAPGSRYTGSDGVEYEVDANGIPFPVSNAQGAALGGMGFQN